MSTTDRETAIRELVEGPLQFAIREDGGDLRYLVFSEKIPLTKEKNTHPNGLKRAKLLN